MKVWTVIGFILFATALAALLITHHNPSRKEANIEPDGNFQLNSPVFAENGDIPDKYTCKGENISPPLEISGIPDGTASLALIMHDPNAPSGDFLHWTVWNISPETKSIAENSVPHGAVQGQNGFGESDYGGPCPPSGTHHYEFDMYALKTKLNLPAGSSRTQLEQAMRNQIIAETKLVGLCAAK